jgi:Na+-transporting NADH:ubiquinone oxidoreductase subunit NqrB
VASKFVFRSQNKHFFNPANFGVVFMVLFTGVAYISPAQWGNAAILLFILGSFGLLILTNIRKMDLAISWIVFFFGMDYLWNIYYKNWPLDFFVHSISSGSMILFTFFMITDPSSTPNSRVARVIWVFLVAALAFYLQAFKFIKGAPLYSLFIMSFTVPCFDYIFKDESRFSWDSMYRRPLYNN